MEGGKDEVIPPQLEVLKLIKNENLGQELLRNCSFWHRWQS